jgi:hypothetical protein
VAHSPGYSRQDAASAPSHGEYNIMPGHIEIHFVYPGLRLLIEIIYQSSPVNHHAPPPHAAETPKWQYGEQFDGKFRHYGRCDCDLNPSIRNIYNFAYEFFKYLDRILYF